MSAEILRLLASNPAAGLRATAALMRERAEAATPGPWRHEQRLGQVPASVVHAPPGAIRGQRRDLPVTADTFGRDGKHIASWHPDVALAAARSLDQHAEEHDAYDCNWGDACASLAFARAYVGEAGR